jgi:hypothetical protein
MGDAYSLVRIRVTVNTETLEQIIEHLNIPTKADRDRILRDGIVIVRGPSPPGGGGRRSAGVRSARSSTASRAPSTTSRTRRRRT